MMRILLQILVATAGAIFKVSFICRKYVLNCTIQ